MRRGPFLVFFPLLFLLQKCMFASCSLKIDISIAYIHIIDSQGSISIKSCVPFCHIGYWCTASNFLWIFQIRQVTSNFPGRQFSLCRDRAPRCTKCVGIKKFARPQGALVQEEASCFSSWKVGHLGDLFPPPFHLRPSRSPSLPLSPSGSNQPVIHIVGPSKTLAYLEAYQLSGLYPGWGEEERWEGRRKTLKICMIMMKWLLGLGGWQVLVSRIFDGSTRRA